MEAVWHVSLWRTGMQEGEWHGKEVCCWLWMYEVDEPRHGLALKGVYWKGTWNNMGGCSCTNIEQGSLTSVDGGRLQCQG